MDEINKQNLEMLILPGGLQCTINYLKSTKVKKFIKFAYNVKIPIVSFGTASILLGETGILNGRNAVCYPGMEEYLMGANISDRSIVIDQNIITVKSSGFVFELSFKILEMLKGKNEVKKVKEHILYDT